MRKYSNNTDLYTDPQTGVLKNKLGYTTQESLEHAEAHSVAMRSHEIRLKPITGNFDLSHLQAIHKKLFSDIYEWAGEVRRVDITKGTTRFAHHAFIESETKKITDQLKHEQCLRGLSAESFSQRAGHYLGELNVIRPFREGNGRTLREYVGQLAKQAGYEITWEGIDRQAMTQASINAYQGSSDLMAKLIHDNLVDSDRELALQLADDKLGKPPTSIIEPQQGKIYTGKVLAVTKRYAAQINDKTHELVLHQRQSLSHVQENTTVEIAYLTRDTGFIRNLPNTEHNHSQTLERSRDFGDRDR